MALVGELKMKFIKYFIFILLGVFSSQLFATVGGAAQRLMGPTEIITRLMLVACYILGVLLIIMAVAQYKQHRESPKLVPLTTPIMLVMLGVVCLLIPYWSTITETFSAVEQAKKDGMGPDKGSLPTPPPLPRQAGPGSYLQKGTAPAESDYYEEQYEDDSGY
jgi:membrane-associated HD superfamily phosphohydrolase